VPAPSPVRRRLLLRLLLVTALPVLLLPLTAPPAAAHRPHAVRSWIAFVSDRDSLDQTDEVNDEIYLLDPRTRRTVRITDDPGIDQVPLISPDGRRLLWQSDRSTAAFPNPEGRFHLWTCRLQLSQRRPSCVRPRVVPREDLPTLTISYAWLPGHRSVVYTDLSSNLYRVALDGSAPVLVAAKREGALSVNQPTVAPDGRTVVVNDTGDLWRIDLTTGARTQLTATPAVDAAPEYSPDGSRLVFHSNRSGDGFDVWTMAAAPEGPDNPAVDLTADVTGPDGSPSWERYPTWSPDGRQVAFAWYLEPSTSYAGGFNESEIYRVDARGGRVTNLTRNFEPDLRYDDPAQIGDIQPDWGGHARRS
jgi:Tol biopolymer transport system component